MGRNLVMLIAIYNSERCIGRCDARCYNAKGPSCDCCCGGRNHSVGLRRAQENTRKHGETIVERWNAEHPDQRIEIEPVQQELFR